MKKKSHLVSLMLILLLAAGIMILFNKNHFPDTNVQNQFFIKDSTKYKGENMDEKITRSESEWKEILTPEEYRVLRQKGTERAFTGEYDSHFEKGMYKCAGCGNVLFESDTKFDSGCGWPSFFKPLAGDRVVYKEDRSYGMVRTEVMCAKCGGHLGHVFEDGPDPTGLRYCINSVSLKFEKKKE